MLSPRAGTGRGGKGRGDVGRWGDGSGDKWFDRGEIRERVAAKCRQGIRKKPTRGQKRGKGGQHRLEVRGKKRVCFYTMSVPEG